MDELAPCGTAGAYRRHQRHGEKPCEKCRAWYNARRGHDRARHSVFAPGVIEAIGLCGCPLGESHWAEEMSVAAGMVAS